MRVLRWAWMSLAVVAACASSALASSSKPPVWLLAVGANEGLMDETPLRYAVEDARRYAATLQQVGGLAAADMHVLEQPDASTLRTALASLAERAATASTAPVLHFYYSGHGDRDSLHLGATRFSRSELERALAAVPAQIRFVVLDTCRRTPEGTTKGFARVPGFQVRLSGPDRLEGTVTLSAASLGEAAQESSKLRAAVFSHALVTGLRGAADVDRDWRVTLDELYRYAYRQTVLRSSATTGEVMHPSVDVDLTGAGELVLGRIAPSSAAIVFPPEENVRFIVFPRATATIVADVWADPDRPVRLPVMPGQYLVTRRGPSGGGALELSLGDEETRRADAGSFRPVDLGVLAQRGGRLKLRTHELRLGAGVGYRLGLGPIGRLTWNHGGPRWRWGLGVAASLSSYTGSQLAFRTVELEASAFVQWRTSWVDLGAGAFARSLRVEGTRLDRAVTVGIVAADRTVQWGAGFGPRLSIGRRFDLTGGWDFGVAVAADLLLLREDGKLTPRPEAFLIFSTGYEL